MVVVCHPVQDLVGFVALGSLEVVQAPGVNSRPFEIALLLVVLAQVKQALAQFLIHRVLLVLPLQVQLERLDCFGFELWAH